MKSCLKTSEQQTLEFITFCTEMYAGKKNVSGSKIAKMFCDFGVFEFLEENCIELHAQSREFLIAMIDEFLETRSKSSLARLQPKQRHRLGQKHRRH